MKKIAILLISSALLSTSAFAKRAPEKQQDVLAVCSKESARAPLFEIIGDLNSFTGLRMTAQFGEVILKNIHSKTPYSGVATLTKSGPYQFILNGYSTPSPAASLTHSEENSVLFGVSSGAQLTITKNRDGIELTNYTCNLHTALLLNP